MRMPAGTKEATGMTGNSIEVIARGEWVYVPVVEVNGQPLVTHGRWLKIASVHDEEWLVAETSQPELCAATLKNQKRGGVCADIFTFAQKLPNKTPKYEYPMEWESVAAVELTSFKEWWEKLPQETRKNVRRSQRRGVTVSVKPFDDNLIKGISDVNNDSPIRQRVRNVHYGKSLERVRKDYSSFVDRSDFIVTSVGEETIGFLKLVYRGEVASILSLTTKHSHYDKRPGNALIAKAVELCEAKGVHYLTYGLFNYGNKGDNPLREFKIRNGFQEVVVPRFYLPLNLWGKLCFKLKAHRGLIGILPQNVITAGLSARARWYTLKQWMSRCSSMLERPNRDRQMGCSNPPAGSSL
jgi:hypothetical protein